MVDHSKFYQGAGDKPKERSLTAGEVEIAQSVFGNAIDYDKVRISPNKFSIFTDPKKAVTPNDTIYMSRNYKDDFSKEYEDMLTGDSRSLFIHEMTHVWQWQNDIKDLSDVAMEAVESGFDYDEAYNYDSNDPKNFLEYGVEQQASIVENYYNFKNSKERCFEEFEAKKEMYETTSPQEAVKDALPLVSIFGEMNEEKIKKFESQFCEMAESYDPQKEYQNYLDDRQKKCEFYESVLGNGDVLKNPSSQSSYNTDATMDKPQANQSVTLPTRGR